MATQADISFYQGEDVTLTVTMNPTANITGWALTFTVRQLYGGDSVFTKTVGSGITITNGAGGVFTVTIAKANTSSLEPRAYVFDIARTDSGFQTVLTIGTLTLLPQVNLA